MICCKCQQDKPEEAFHVNKTRARGRQNACKECRKAIDQDYNKKNSKKRVLQKSALRERNREFIRSYLLSQSCENCGENDIRCLDFAHKDASTKSFNVGEAANKFLYGLNTIRQEINKCKVLCANCHRKETAEERGSYKNNRA